MQVTGDDELAAQSPADWESAGATATQLVSAGKLVEAGHILRALDRRAAPPEVASRIANDLGVIAVLAGDTLEAAVQFGEAISRRPEWIVPQRNLQRIQPTPPPQPAADDPAVRPQAIEQSRTRVAIVSLLFNWPSTGGGTVHTAETARFLQRAGYDVRHLSLRFDPWGLGQVRERVDWPLQELAFTEADWHLDAIQRRVRETLEAFQPDAVIVTDSWSMKPRLAEACRGFRTYLRLAAQECLCPLTNVRLLAVQPEPVSCPRHQLATPDVCRQCVTERNQNSGTLHQWERQLAGFPTSDYVPALQRAFADAAGILVVNPLIAEMCKPYAQAVHVLPSGFDPDRFPWTTYRDLPESNHRPLTLFFAGLTQEVMKGFHVLREACCHLWSERQDFRLRITADAEPNADAFCEFVGWQSQASLPRQLREADIVVCPTIAEEALGRTAVEAMGAWRPVVASRIGGLPFTVLDEATGVLCRPGDPVDLARQLTRLLDDASLRERLGTAGRRRFDAVYAWPVILEQGYRPLLGPAVRAASVSSGKEGRR